MRSPGGVILTHTQFNSANASPPACRRSCTAIPTPPAEACAKLHFVAQPGSERAPQGLRVVIWDLSDDHLGNPAPLILPVILGQLFEQPLSFCAITLRGSAQQSERTVGLPCENKGTLFLVGVNSQIFYCAVPCPGNVHPPPPPNPVCVEGCGTKRAKN